EGERAVPGGPSSFARFARASTLSRAATGDPVRAAFGVLENVAQGDYSRWNIVYEPARGRVSWRTRRSPAGKWIDLAAFDLSCAPKVQVLDVDEPRPGDARARFVPYSAEANRRLVAESLASLPHAEGAVERVAAYPESDRCLGPGR